MQQSLHTTHIPLGFADVCDRVRARAFELQDGPSANAVRHVERAATAGKLDGFEPDTTVRLHNVELEQVTDDYARMRLDWRSDSDEHRLLPHVRAELRIHAGIAKGPNASTSISIVGAFEPSKGLRRHIDDVIFGRRIVDDALHRFLDLTVALIANNGAEIDLRDSAGSRT